MVGKHRIGREAFFTSLWRPRQGVRALGSQDMEELGHGRFRKPEFLPSSRGKARGMGCLPGVAGEIGHGSVCALI